MAQKSKQKKNSTEGYITEAPYANPANCEYVESAMQAPIDSAPQSAMQDDGLRKIPAGMNRNNTEQDFLILILESLYRIEKKLGA